MGDAEACGAVATNKKFSTNPESTMKKHVSVSLLVAALAAGTLAVGCSSSRGAMAPDRGMMQNGEPSATEMTELCNMHRRMAGLTPDAQEAMLESHMQSAHGSSNAQTMSMHRQTMLRRCSR